MKTNQFVFLALLLFVSLFLGCNSADEYAENLDIDIKEGFETQTESDDVDLTLKGIIYTTGYALNSYSDKFEDPAIQVCILMKNNNVDRIKPMMEDIISRIRLFHRGVECERTNQVKIRGKVITYSEREKNVLPERTIRACLGYRLTETTGTVETSFYYKENNDTHKINHIVSTVNI